MIEATCSACGTRNRIAETDVPIGAKFVTCTSCKSRIGLPAQGGGRAPWPKLPPPVPPKGAAEVALGPAGGGNNDIDVSDLPAPRRGSPLGPEASKPAPKSALSSALDGELPTPKSRLLVPELPTPKSRAAPSPLDLDDLLPAATDVSDLPAPRGARPITRAPTPQPHPEVSDLPAPRDARTSTAPKSVAASNAPVIDLPTPRPGGARAITDLPAPKVAPPVPTQRPLAGVTDLPVPKGQAPGSTDLPAPKGFFDDLPQPARGRGRGVEVPEVPEMPEVPAPKGFFDDLPQPARGTKGGPQAPSNDIAPKGFFDDLPQKAQNRAGLPTPVAHESPAPKGFFDDLPQPARSKQPSVAPRTPFGAGALDLGDDPIEPIDLAPEEPGLDSGSSFDELDLSAPSTPQTRVGAEEAAKASIKFATPKQAPATGDVPGKPAVPSVPRFSGHDMELELEEPRDKAQLPGPAQRLGPLQKQAPGVIEAVRARPRKNRRNIIAAISLAVALGSGGFFMYRRHAAQQERTDTIGESLTAARKAMLADDPDHWRRAAGAASKVLELDPKHAEAYGIAAEASIAGALADGKTATVRIAHGRKLIADALGAGITGPALDRAQALATLTSNPDAALAKLEALLTKAPKDGALALYLGWAHAANGNGAEAIKAYDRALESPTVKVLALLGRAHAKLLGNDIEAARADFTAVLSIEDKNVPAQVGLAATMPVGQAQQQESDLLAVLARKDIASGDPRAVVQAWVLAADLARKGGRLDAARERYRKALAFDAKDLGGMTGLAEIELRENKIELAEELITKALTIAPNNANAQLVQCEISLRKGDIPDAEKRIQLLHDRQPPLPPLDRSRLMLVKGRLHEIRKQDEEAVAAYIEGAKLAGDRDLIATFAAVAKLTQMANDARTANNLENEGVLRKRAEQLLSALSELARDDPQLALTLGNAYLQSGDAEKAEPWLRRVLAVRPKNPDALYQLGKVLRRQGKGFDAVVQLQQARELEPNRSEIGLELARTYELTHRDAEAAALYMKLLEDPDPSIELRGHAGTFFVRTRKLGLAAEQGKKILAADRLSAAGHYLNAEGLLADGHLEEARKDFLAAVEIERDARYLDGLGRATESQSIQRNTDLALQDSALRAYQEATKLDPTLFSSLLGMGRLYVARREMPKAVTALLAANKLKADDAEVSFLLGVAYQALNTKETKKVALEWFRRSNKIKESAETSYLLGQLYQDTDINQVPPAIESYKIATRRADEEIKKTGKEPSWYAEALYQLGDLANSVGDELTACKAWRLYLGSTGPKNPVRVGTANRALATGLQGACP